MKTRKGCICGRGGFILLEVVPALLLLAAVGALCGRMAWLGLAFETGGRQGRERLEGFVEAWRAWGERGGRAAVVVRGADGAWRVWDFPDESWLPPAGEGAGGDGVQYWRRRPHGDAGAVHWDVEALDPRASSWRGYMRIREAALVGGGAP